MKRVSFFFLLVFIFISSCNPYGEPEQDVIFNTMGDGSCFGPDCYDLSDSYNIMMFSTGPFDGSMGNGSVARDVLDDQCKLAQNSNNYFCSTSVRAFISIDASDTISSMPSNFYINNTLPIMGVDGIQIANNWADLLDGSIETSLSSAGIIASNAMWYSGSTEIGFLNVVCNSTNAWDSNSSVFNGTVGHASYVDVNWINYTPVTCDSSFYLLCLCY